MSEELLGVEKFIFMSIENHEEIDIFKSLLEMRTRNGGRIARISLTAPTGEIQTDIEKWGRMQIDRGGALHAWLMPWQGYEPDEQTRKLDRVETHETLDWVLARAREVSGDFCILGLQTGAINFPQSLEDLMEIVRDVQDIQQENLSVQGCIRSIGVLGRTPDGQRSQGYGDDLEVRVHICPPGTPGIRDAAECEDQAEIMEQIREVTGMENLREAGQNLEGFGWENRN